ncbi:MAG: hypothetical protein K2L11_02480, partial [Muribaculaceae bacterium]|nr:hypothetical protein [Muribaculaceae bacterium]
MKKFLLTILASGAFSGAMAIPAKPGLIAFTQPDGTVINVRMIGDEHGHMIYSEEGALLVEAGERLEYARFNKNGFPEASGIMATSGNWTLVKSMNLQSDVQIENWADKMATNRNLRIDRLMDGAKKRVAATRGDGDAVADSDDMDEEEIPGEDDGRLVPMCFGRCDVTFPVLGEQKGLVILVEYDDIEFKYGDYDYFHRMLNEEGFSDHGSLGSARDWFVENSDGKFLPDFDVYGPVKLPNQRSYYGGNDHFG